MIKTVHDAWPTAPDEVKSWLYGLLPKAARTEPNMPKTKMQWPRTFKKASSLPYNTLLHAIYLRKNQGLPRPWCPHCGSHQTRCFNWRKWRCLQCQRIYGITTGTMWRHVAPRHVRTMFALWWLLVEQENGHSEAVGSFSSDKWHADCAKRLKVDRQVPYKIVPHLLQCAETQNRPLGECRFVPAGWEPGFMSTPLSFLPALAEQAGRQQNRLHYSKAVRVKRKQAILSYRSQKKCPF